MPVRPELPEILNRADFGGLAGREPKSVAKMADRGLLAEPTHQHQGKPIWERSAALDWFRSLHDHAVVVPGNEPAFAELREHGIYMCPATSNHLSLARPRLLVMYTPGGGGRVFEVTEVETVGQGLPGTRATTPGTVEITRTRESEDRRTYPSWTVFFLSEAGAIEVITPVIQQGRYVTTGDVQQAMVSGKLLVQPLDKAFPVRQ
ncbi:hypothetical protein B7C62_18285 [Kitasatospora albolonga]|uniref:Restriction endonuclease domain-containing protein n=1 Tax=Kitasatospora albolonga TaxID=68173 RepID=A0ABC8BUQ2_9ACTN|nr:hypothetical protein B7C62_18285 [Kitasatospora albolonga]